MGGNMRSLLQLYHQQILFTVATQTCFWGLRYEGFLIVLENPRESFESQLIPTTS